MREFLVAYLEYEQRMHVANEDGGDRVLARGRGLVDSATQMMVADEFYNGKPWIDLSEQELKKGLETFAGGGEARWSAVHAEAWQDAGRGDISGNRSTRVSPQDGKGDEVQSRSA